MIKFAAIALAFGGAVAQTSAQDTITLTDRTSNLNIALTGYVQTEESENSMNVERVRITSKDIVNFAEAGNRAKLMIVTPVDYDGDTRVVVRESVGGETQETDLSGFFGASTQWLVEQSQTRGDRTTGKQYSIDDFSFGGDETPVGFDVQGFTTANISNGSFSSNVNGTGYTPAGDAVLSGKISASGGKNETFTVEVGE